MNRIIGRPLLVGALGIVAVGLSGCVTNEKFEAHVAEFNALSEKVSGIDSRVSALDGRVGQVASAAQAAQARADEAYTLADGKFLMTEVSSESVLFNTGSSKLTDEAKATLTALVEKLKTDNKNVYLTIIGHADPRGGAKYNRNLGRERAGVVGRFLVDAGVPGNKVQAGSWGEDKPTENGLAADRRVEVIVNKP